MAKSKVNMPKELSDKCKIAIHAATVAAGAAGAIPIPVADTIPISAAQVTMIVALGKVFDITISESVAKSIITVGLAQTAGRAVVSSAFKMFPGIGTIVGGVISSTTAVAITEGLGWLVADDVFRIYSGENPQNIVDAVKDLDDFRSSNFSNVAKSQKSK